MIQTILNSAVCLSLIAAICYGISGPLMRIASQAGATPYGLALCTAIGMALVSINWTSPTILFTSNRAIGLAILIGIILGVAFRAVSQAFSLPTGYVSLICIIMALHPLISSFIGLCFMDEASKVILPKMIFGSLLVVGGIILVVTSVK